MICITLYSAHPPFDFGLPVVNGLDKAEHFIVFGLLAMGLLRGLRTKLAAYPAFILALVITSFFGILDELHQSSTPGRQLDFYDWLADTSGAFVATFAYTYWSSFRKFMRWEPPLPHGADHTAGVTALPVIPEKRVHARARYVRLFSIAGWRSSKPSGATAVN